MSRKSMDYTNTTVPLQYIRSMSMIIYGIHALLGKARNGHEYVYSTTSQVCAMLTIATSMQPLLACVQLTWTLNLNVGYQHIHSRKDTTANVLAMQSIWKIGPLQTENLQNLKKAD